MLILVHNSPTSLLRDHGRHPNLGVLSCPQRIYTNVEGWPWAADNRAYSGWDEDAYGKMLERVSMMRGCLFVVAPDVVGDHEATRDRFYDWLLQIRNTGHPVAFVAQNGATPANVPWGDFNVLFVGGKPYENGREWKLGVEARAVVDEARRRNRWVHMGRVNSGQRMEIAKRWGCDSIDGTSFSMFRRLVLPRALRYAASGFQPTLDGIG